MTDLSALYQEILLEHAKHPRRFGKLADATFHGHADNPVCGDAVDVFGRVRADRIEEAAFEGAGCAIAMASASMLTVAVEGKTAAEARDLWARLERVLRGEDAGEGLGELAALAGVARFPARVACARLAWEALVGALVA